MQPELDKSEDSPKTSSFMNKVYACFGFVWFLLGVLNVRSVTERCVKQEYWSAYNWMPLLVTLFFGLGWGTFAFMIRFSTFVKERGLKKSYITIMGLVFSVLFLGVGLGIIYSDIEFFEVIGGGLFISFVSAGYYLKMSTTHEILRRRVGNYGE